MEGSIRSESVIEQASHWVVRVASTELVPPEREAFERWLLADERHGVEFAAQSGLWHAFDDIAAADRVPLAAFARGSGRVVARPWLRFRTARLAAAALLVTLLGAGVWLSLQTKVAPPSREFVTRTGEVRTVPLDDGSNVHLNTRTRLAWLSSSSERRIRLLEGEALFDVAPDSSRPFRVELDTSEIRVLGTRFNVYRRSDGGVTLTVFDGVVEVRAHDDVRRSQGWRRELHANQAIEYRSDGPTRDVYDTVSAETVTWREGVLKFNDEPLSKVLSELSRYTDRRLVIGDPRLAHARVAAVVGTRDVRAALARLEKLAPVTVTERDGAYVLSSRASPDLPVEP